MPRISRFYGINIVMWPNDHGRPHFHAGYAGAEASIAIDGLQVLQGGLPARVLSLVREWARDHREELLENWQLARAGEALRPIAPLA